jgi:hypothetical protein
MQGIATTSLRTGFAMTILLTSTLTITENRGIVKDFLWLQEGIFYKNGCDSENAIV